MQHTARVLRLIAPQQSRLNKHLFPGDGKESAALALCGTRLGPDRNVFCIHELHEIPHEVCTLRTASAVRWPVERLVPLLEKAMKRNMWVLKIHSHPDGFQQFSRQDDDSDAELGQHLGRILERDCTHLSAFLNSSGYLQARVVHASGKISGIDRVMRLGDEIHLQDSSPMKSSDDAHLRTRQAFGDKTSAMLQSISAGVAGCSGTGGWIVEMLARLGVGRLVLVDPDHVERKNLNRIVGSTGQDARKGRLKVDMLRDSVEAMELGTAVKTFASDLANRDVIEALAECDVLFGCLDSADGRDLLNRLATYYHIPYLDVGVRLDADGAGGIQQVCCAVHYLLPGGSSLLSRGVITPEQVHAQALRRTNPKQHAALHREGYIKGVVADRPAVVSLNGFAASHAVNELLARLHPFRRDSNEEYRLQTFSLTDGAWLRLPDGDPCSLLARFAGRGDSIPLLGNPALS